MSEMQPDFQFPPVRQLLKELGVRLLKHRSQHFLLNPMWCERIADLCELTTAHTVVEIGTGLGNLSFSLARRAGRVHSVEMDDSFSDWHEQLKRGVANLSIHRGDFLKVDLQELLSREGDVRFVAAGNLPYQITAPILFKLTDCGVRWERIVVMVQQEVAERLVAGAGRRQTSALTCKIALEYDSRIVLKLGPQEFLPPPKVRSAVVVLTPRAVPLVESAHHKRRVYAIITALFQHRRRTAANGLVLGGVCASRDVAEDALRTAGIEPTARPETFSLQDFLGLAEAMPAEAADR